MDLAYALLDDIDIDSGAADNYSSADSEPAMDSEQTTVDFTNAPVYPTPTYVPSRVPEAGDMAENLAPSPENPFGDHAALNSDLEEFLALPTDPFANLERDARTLVTTLQSVMALLSALLSVNSSHRCAERSLRDVIPECELLQCSAIAKISLKAALLPLLTQLRSQVFCFDQSLEAYERSIPEDNGGKVGRVQRYNALAEAAHVSSDIENAVRHCEQSKWTYHWLANRGGNDGAMDGGAWQTGLALTALVGVHAKLLSLRDAATGGGAGWIVFWNVDFAEP